MVVPAGLDGVRRRDGGAAAWPLPADAILTRRHDGDAVRRVYREVVAPERLVFTLSDAPSPDDEARTVLTVQLRAADGGTEQEFRQTGVITDEHFEALKAGTEMFFTRLGEFLAR
jgi:uncharacterized protein YndB with AHSA1/START domain